MIYDIQKASLLKRFSAFLLDFILVCILATGFAALISVIVDFDGTYQEFQGYIEKYNKEFDTDLSKAPSKDASDEEIKNFNDGLEAFNNDKKATRAYGLIVNYVFLMVSIGLLLAFLVVEFMFPLIFKHGRTLGKKIFSIGVVQMTGVKITPFILFARTILGKYTIETMIPVLLLLMVVLNVANIVTIIVIVAIVILQIVVFFVTKRYAFIHDVLASTVVVDMQSQMIFDTKEDLLHYKEELSRKAAEEAEYK